MKKILLLIFVFIILSSFTYSADFGFNSLKLPSLESDKNLYCLITGCSFSGDIYMNNHTIYNANFINATFSGSTVINATQIVGLNDTYVPYFGAINNTDLGTHNLSAGNIISDNGLYTAFLYDNFGNGAIDMTGDPWYLSGVDLQLAQDLQIDGFILSNLYPNPTLTYSLGSGANRWQWLYVANISAEEIETYNLHTLYNVTVDGYINGVNISNLSSSLGSNYVPYIGATKDVDIDQHNFRLNGTIYWDETSGRPELFKMNHTGGDGFSFIYWYDFQSAFDDRLVFMKTDGNDAEPDGGFAWVMQNMSHYNKTVLTLDGDGFANFSGIIQATNITTRSNYICNLTNCFSLTELLNNYTSDEIYIYKNLSNSFNFNETKLNSTIDSKLQTIFYNMTNQSVISGTSSTSNADKYLRAYDNTPFNITEATGVPGMDFRVNFTGVDNFNQIIFRTKDLNTGSVTTTVYLWDYDEGIWESYAVLSDLLDYTVKEIGVYDVTDHISGGIVQMRFYQPIAGNINRKHLFDWITLADGISIPSGAEVDPYSLHTIGGSMYGNINMTSDNITNVNMITNINQSWGIFINDTCIVIGDLNYKASC